VRAFLIALLLTAAAVVILGWTTGIRAAMHATFLVLAVAAFLPFLIILALLLALVIVSAIVTFPALGHGDVGGFDGAGEAIISGGNRFLVGPYYRFLARRRHPVFWGVAGGVLLGALLLLAVIGILIIPGEARTARILLEAQRKIENRNGFPRSLAECGAPAIDGFGRPLEYQVAGKWILESYRLSSLGFDGKPGTDDLCVSGSTRTIKLANAVKELVSERARDRLAAISALQCDR
jgi:hypothetical protein